MRHIMTIEIEHLYKRMIPVLKALSIVLTFTFGHSFAKASLSPQNEATFKNPSNGQKKIIAAIQIQEGSHPCGLIMENSINSSLPSSSVGTIDSDSDETLFIADQIRNMFAKYNIQECHSTDRKRIEYLSKIIEDGPTQLAYLSSSLSKSGIWGLTTVGSGCLAGVLRAAQENSNDDLIQMIMAGGAAVGGLGWLWGVIELMGLTHPTRVLTFGATGGACMVGVRFLIFYY